MVNNVPDRFIKFISGEIRWATLWHCLLIALVGFAAYANTFGVPFHLDDLRAIAQNPAVVNMDIPLADRRAAGLWSFALNYRLHGVEVLGYHALNLAIHIGTALLVYALVGLLYQSRLTTHDSRLTIHHSRSIAFFTAMLFVAHPVQTQAVTYIVQRFASQATFFFVAALFCYARARLGKGGQGVLWHLAGLVSAIVAMKTKEIAFTLPVVIALLELLFFRGALLRRAMLLVPYMLTMAIIPLSFVRVGGGAPAAQVLDQARQATSVQTVLPRVDYLFTQFRVIATYLRLLVFPVNQNLDYDYPVYHSFFAPPVFLSFLLLLALFGAAVWLVLKAGTQLGLKKRKAVSVKPFTTHDSRLTVHNSRLIAFGIFWFFITLSVESSVIPIVDVIFEHRLYLPSVGAILAFVSAVVMFAGRRRLAVPMFAAMTVVVVIFACAAFRRNLVWGDEMSLWSDVTAKSPNLSRPRNNLGYALLKRNEPRRAIPPLVRSIELNPGYTDAYLNIELALRQMGSFSGRMSNSAGTVDARGRVDIRRLRRWGGISNNNLGLAYESMGKYQEAAAAYKKALIMDPGLAEARLNLKAVSDPTIHGSKGE